MKKHQQQQKQGAPGARLSNLSPNHHLWLNNGTWFIHYTIYPTPITKERIRESLNTRDVKAAREIRDEALEGLTIKYGRKK